MGTPARGESDSQRAERAGKGPEMGNYHPGSSGAFYARRGRPARGLIGIRGLPAHVPVADHRGSKSPGSWVPVMDGADYVFQLGVEFRFRLFCILVTRSRTRIRSQRFARGFASLFARWQIG